VARIKLLGVRFSAGEFVRLSAWADAQGLTPTAWVRHQALSAINGKPEPPARFQAPPTADSPAKLTRTAGTRFSEEQLEALAAHANACGLTVTAFIRKVILGVKPVARIPATRAAIVAVNRVGNNLNQLVRLANSGVVLAPELLGVLREVHAEFRALQVRLLRADAGDDRKPETSPISKL
jgi:Mobilization protein NikA